MRHSWVNSICEVFWLSNNYSYSFEGATSLCIWNCFCGFSYLLWLFWVSFLTQCSLMEVNILSVIFLQENILSTFLFELPQKGSFENYHLAFLSFPSGNLIAFIVWRNQGISPIKKKCIHSSWKWYNKYHATYLLNLSALDKIMWPPVQMFSLSNR